MHTAFNSLRNHLERDPLATGLRNVDTEDQFHSCVFPPHIRLSFLQLNVGISQFQDTSAVNSKNVNEHLAGKSLVLYHFLFLFYQFWASFLYSKNGNYQLPIYSK